MLNRKFSIFLHATFHTLDRQTVSKLPILRIVFG